MSKREKEFAIGQLISDAIADASTIEVLAAAGMKTPEISVLSEEYLSEIQNMEYKSLALEALKKILTGEIKARQQRNVLEAKAFSERLEAAVARYHANAITSLEMIQELVDMAKYIQASVQCGDILGLSKKCHRRSAPQRKRPCQAARSGSPHPEKIRIPARSRTNRY